MRQRSHLLRYWRLEAGPVRGRGAGLLRQLHHPRLHAPRPRLSPPQPLLRGQGGSGQYHLGIRDDIKHKGTPSLDTN